MLGEKYWDLFQTRIEETSQAITQGTLPPLRRISLHITNRCNLACSYCNEKRTTATLPEEMFKRIIAEYSEMGGGVLHITGGEPACVPYLFDAIAEVKINSNVDIHVNTNLVAGIAAKALCKVKRLKVSLDSYDAEYFNKLVGIPGAFEKVTKHLKVINILNSVGQGPIVSLTYTMTKENYSHIPKFLEMYYKEFPHLYAVFFSAYKGKDPRFAFTGEDIKDLFDNYVPVIDDLMKHNGDKESRFLFHASHEPSTFVDHTRFPDNEVLPCYLQLSELTVDEHGNVGNCSHLFRDGVGNIGINLKDLSLPEAFKQAKEKYMFKPMHEKCKYGCNKKLVTFNKQVHELVKEVL